MARAKTVLIVDDEPGMVRALAAVLEDAGFRVETAANGIEAMRRLGQPDLPDLVLLDFLMPRKDGADTLLEIRDEERFAALPVVMMSGVIESMIRRRCKNRRYEAFLRKPFRLDELVETIEGVLGKRGASRARRSS